MKFFYFSIHIFWLSFSFIFPNISSAEVLEKVVIEGIGSSVDKAIQNAAERALMQVVGVYVDSETLISKRKEIKNGVKTEAKSINKDMLKVSNGSIKDVKVIEVISEGILFRVEALVVVRVDNLKVLIKPFIVAKTKVSEGLFASIKKNKKQDSDKIQLINKRIIQPILSGKNIGVKIMGLKGLSEEAELIPKWVEEPKNLVPLPNFLPYAFSYFEGSRKNTNKYFDTLSNNLKRNLKADESVVVLSVETRLSVELQNQIKDILDKFSKKKYVINWITRAGIREFERRSLSQADRIICTFLPITITCYIIDVGRPFNNKKIKDINGYLTNKWSEKIDRLLTYKTYISLIGNNNETILKDFVSYPISSNFNKLKYRFNSSSFLKKNRHLTSLKTGVNSNFAREGLFIPFVSNDFIYMRLKDEQLAKIKSIEVFIASSEEFIKQNASK